MWDSAWFRVARRLSFMVIVALWASHLALRILPPLGTFSAEEIEEISLKVFPFAVMGLFGGYIVPRITLSRQGTLSRRECVLSYLLFFWILFLYWGFVTAVWASPLGPWKRLLMGWLIGLIAIPIPVGLWLYVSNAVLVVVCCLLPMALVARVLVWLIFRRWIIWAPALD